MTDQSDDMLAKTLARMQAAYATDPVAAVRSQSFIKLLHRHVATELESRLTPRARKRGVRVVEEATIFGSHKPKDVDVALVEPSNGPLMLIGVRSQMSSIGKNVLTYYQDIVGEAISLQDRFPRSVFGYVYLHPARDAKSGASVDHQRYALMYNSISGRSGRNYHDTRGVYDEFAYMIPDFDASPPCLIRPTVDLKVDDPVDLRFETFVDRMVNTFKQRNIWMDMFA